MVEPKWSLTNDRMNPMRLKTGSHRQSKKENDRVLYSYKENKLFRVGKELENQ